MISRVNTNSLFGILRLQALDDIVEHFERWIDSTDQLKYGSYSLPYVVLRVSHLYIHYNHTVKYVNMRYLIMYIIL